MMADGEEDGVHYIYDEDRPVSSSATWATVIWSGWCNRCKNRPVLADPVGWAATRSGSSACYSLTPGDDRSVSLADYISSSDSSWSGFERRYWRPTTHLQSTCG